MSFFILLVMNLIIAVVIYLLLLVKIERMSSSFHETKMRQEMDEVLNEFNAAANRNIDILDNRISLLKKLTEKTDKYKSVDITNYDENYKFNQKKENNVKQQNNSFVEKVKSGISSVLENTIDYKKKNDEIGSVFDVKLDKNYDNLISDFSNVEEEKEKEPIKDLENQSKEEILNSAFEKTNDRYTLLLNFFEDGYPIDLLSKYSGVPEGEIKLIVNLNKSQE